MVNISKEHEMYDLFFHESLWDSVELDTSDDLP